MGWFANLKRRRTEKKEVKTLKQEEKTVEVEELKLIVQAIQTFTNAMKLCYFTSTSSQKMGWIALKSLQHSEKLLAQIDQTQKILFNLNSKSRKLVRMADRIEADLVGGVAFPLWVPRI